MVDAELYQQLLNIIASSPTLSLWAIHNIASFATGLDLCHFLKKSTCIFKWKWSPKAPSLETFPQKTFSKIHSLTHSLSLCGYLWNLASSFPKYTISLVAFYFNFLLDRHLKPPVRTEYIKVLFENFLFIFLVANKYKYLFNIYLRPIISNNNNELEIWWSALNFFFGL